jgi:hypothetical protein
VPPAVALRPVAGRAPGSARRSGAAPRCLSSTKTSAPAGSGGGQFRRRSEEGLPALPAPGVHLQERDGDHGGGAFLPRLARSSSEISAGGTARCGAIMGPGCLEELETAPRWRASGSPPAQSIRVGFQANPSRTPEPGPSRLLYR